MTVGLLKNQEESAAYQSWESEGGNSGKTHMNAGLILLLTLDRMVEDAMAGAIHQAKRPVVGTSFPDRERQTQSLGGMKPRQLTSQRAL